MSEWWNLKSAIASIDSRLDQAMGLAKEPEPSDAPDPTPITPVADFDLPEDQLKFLDIYTERFESLASKIKHLVEENVRLLAGKGADPAAATAKKVNLLLEEGTRLSAQELKLNAAIKRLRSQVSEAAKKSAEELDATTTSRISALEQEIRDLHGTVKGLERDVDEKNAAIEHYKHASGPTGSASSAAPGPSPESIESLTQNHEAARENWLAMESRLLATIATLESAIEQRDSRIRELNERVAATLAQAQDLRVLAQNDKRALQESETAAKALETKLKDQIASLESQFKAQIQHLEAENTELKARAQPSAQVENPSVPAEPSNPDSPAPAELQEIAETLLQSVDPQLEPQLELQPQPEPAEHELYDDVGVPPLEPLADPGVPFDISHSGIESRRSSVHSEVATDTHLVAKLNQANRKLEAQLLMANESLETTRNEKEAAYADMVKYMTAGENAERLERENKELNAKLDTLLVKLGQKSERVTELQADVEDLKDMYKEQVTELVNQIERLRSA